jgi:C-terminal processing protease CtpA/Prc
VKRKLLILPVTVLLLIVLLSTCQLFLGPEPDTSPSEVLKSLWNDFNNIHANLDFRMSNNLKYNSWYDVYHNQQNGYALKTYPDMSDELLFSVCANMLKELNDPHVGLFAPGNYASSYVEDRSEYFSAYTARSYLYGRGNDEYKNFIYGVFLSNPGIGYIYISSFINEDSDSENQEWGKEIGGIINSLANTRAIVLDVRSNRGGEIFAMEYIAAYFASEQKDYIKARTKTGPGPNDLSAPKIYTVKSVKTASNNMYGYTKPIVLLTNRSTVSAAEWFTLALRTQNHVTHTGTPTCGALSSRKDRFMINGWFYSISPERVTDMNGKFYEGIGISPDKERQQVNTTGDEQLEYAVKLAGGL